MLITRGRSLLAAAAVVLGTGTTAVAVAADGAPAPKPGEFPTVTISADRGSTTAALISSCTAAPTGSTCGDGTVVGSPPLHLTRGAPLTVHVDGAAAPAAMDFFDATGHPLGRTGPDPTFAPLPPGTAQFTAPASLPDGAYAGVTTAWDTPEWRGDASYAVRLLFEDERAATRIVSVDLLRRARRTRPPGLRVRVSDPGTITVRWRSGTRSGRRTARIARESATVALLGLPGRPRRAVRVTVTLDPAASGLAPSRLTRVFRARR